MTEDQCLTGKKQIILFVAVSVLMVSASASSLSLAPSNLDFNLEKGEKECRNLTLVSEMYRGKLEGEILWAEKGENSTKLSEHQLNSSEVGIDVEFRDRVENFSGRERITVCVTPRRKEFRHGAVFFKAVSGKGRVGVGIGSWLEVDSREERSSSPTALLVSDLPLKNIGIFVFVIGAGFVGFLLGRGGKD